MSVESKSIPLVNSMRNDFHAAWKSLVLTDIFFKLIAFVVLTPLVGILFRSLIGVSGRTVVSDMDIVLFFLGPVGWVCGILVGALWLAIIALEMASLTAIICATEANQGLGVLGAIRFASTKALSVIRVTSRMIVWTLITAAPVFVVGGIVYLTLLTEFDINYYLTVRPPAFQIAVALGVFLLVVLAMLLMRLMTSWFFALPLVLFEDVSPTEALQVSAARAQGRRWKLLCWIVGWGLCLLVLSAIATAAVGMIGRTIVPTSTGSLQRLIVTIGGTLVLWAVASLAVNVLGATTFASMLFNLYRRLGSFQGTKLSVRGAQELQADQGFQITRRRILLAGIVGSLVAIVVGAVAIHSVSLEDKVDIMAHRGSSSVAPENTLAAIGKAIEEEADWVEIDVQETADGEVVVVHDSDLMKMAGRDLKIWNANMSDLKEIDVGSWFAPEFEEERLPTLAEVLDLCKGKIRVNIELKYYGHDQQLEERVVKLVESREMATDVVAMSLKLAGVQKLKKLRPDWKVGLLMSVAAGDLSNLEVDFLAVNASFVNRSFVRSAHRQGKEVFVWTVNDPATMSAMIGRGVDAILTDQPALARRVLQQRAEMSGPERLLLEFAGILGVTPQLGEP